MKGIKWVSLFVGAAASTALGAGFQLYTEGSAEALGQAGAISGRTGLVSQAWYNPAALAGAKESSVMVGSTYVQIKTAFKSDLSSTLNESMADDWRPVPHLYYVEPLTDNLTGMLSVNAPYGLITEWSSGWAGSLAAVYSELAMVYITPSFAYQVNDELSVGAGLNMVYSKAELTANRGPLLGERKIAGDDISFGYTLSGHYQIAENWGGGVRYQSGVEIKPEGRVSFTSGLSADATGYADIPATVNLGIANTSVEKLTLGLDLVWTEWSSYDQLRFEFGAGYPLTNPEVNAKLWNDVWSVRLGGEYALAESWALRAGYVWDQSPVEDATRAPELPGSDRQMLMAGIGWKGEQLSIDLAYSFLWADKTETGAGIVAAVPTAAGEYETTTHLLAFSAGYSF